MDHVPRFLIWHIKHFDIRLYVAVGPPIYSGTNRLMLSCNWQHLLSASSGQPEHKPRFRTVLYQSSNVYHCCYTYNRIVYLHCPNIHPKWCNFVATFQQLLVLFVNYPNHHYFRHLFHPMNHCPKKTMMRWHCQHMHRPMHSIPDLHLHICMPCLLLLKSVSVQWPNTCKHHHMLPLSLGSTFHPLIRNTIDTMSRFPHLTIHIYPTGYPG